MRVVLLSTRSFGFGADGALGLNQDGWCIEAAADVLKRFLLTLLLKIFMVESAQVECARVDVGDENIDVFVTMHASG